MKCSLVVSQSTSLKPLSMCIHVAHGKEFYRNVLISWTQEKSRNNTTAKKNVEVSVKISVLKRKLIKLQI